MAVWIFHLKVASYLIVFSFQNTPLFNYSVSSSSWHNIFLSKPILVFLNPYPLLPDLCFFPFDTLLLHPHTLTNLLGSFPAIHFSSSLPPLSSSLLPHSQSTKPRKNPTSSLGLHVRNPGPTQPRARSDKWGRGGGEGWQGDEVLKA